MPPDALRFTRKAFWDPSLGSVSHFSQRCILNNMFAAGSIESETRGTGLGRYLDFRRDSLVICQIRSEETLSRDIFAVR